jgi:hypothetical protein
MSSRYPCLNNNCNKTFTTLYSAKKHSNSKSCKYFTGIEIPIQCPNNCGKTFTGSQAKSNSKIHSKSKMCSMNPDRIADKDYKTIIKHVIMSDDTKFCNYCKEYQPINSFASKLNSKNNTKLDYVCYKCRAFLAISNGCIQRAKKEKNSTTELTREYFKSLLVDTCPVFGFKLQYGGDKCNNASATIDAIDHSIGHIKCNLKIISRLANTIKNNSTITEMEYLVRALETWKPFKNDISPEITIQEPDDNMKQCSLCRLYKLKDMFHKNKESKSGLSSKCIRCYALKSMYSNAKVRAKEKEINFEIDIKYLLKLANNINTCPILGVNLLYGGTGKINDNSASLDRFDPNKGYVPDNLWIISYKSNRMKSDATISQIKSVLQYMKDNTVVNNIEVTPKGGAGY